MRQFPVSTMAMAWWLTSCAPDATSRFDVFEPGTDLASWRHDGDSIFGVEWDAREQDCGSLWCFWQSSTGELWRVIPFTDVQLFPEEPVEFAGNVMTYAVAGAFLHEFEVLKLSEETYFPSTETSFTSLSFHRIR